ncbi:apolipoprotein N-acyltransferase [Tamlana sp. I1]|uniref:apolipoprotein N-acyltransferase n=1 Tax=Tamlana sp. I1 TaxID=2762061 RepID=UPI00188E9F68|nr:apolipoprotein N-acyltransferase [Tamlana sp. I1]
MRILKHINYIIIVLSAILSGIAGKEMIIPLFLFSWSLFFYAIFNSKQKMQALINGFVFGVVYGLILFNWILSALQDYTSNIKISLLVIVGLAFVYGAMFALFAYILHFLNGFQFKKWAFLKLLCIACSLTLFDELFSYLYSGIPFLNLRVGFTLSRSLYLTQFAKIGGVAFLSFIVFYVNLSIAQFYILKTKQSFLVIVSSILVFLGVGYALYLPNESPSKDVKVSVATANINPKLTWNQKNSDYLAEIYFSVCRDASSNNSDFIIWPETTIPWLYEKDDDFVDELLEINKNKPTTLIIGANKLVGEHKIANSVLFTSNMKGHYATYSKNILLEAFEKPFLNTFQLPFYAHSKLKYINVGDARPISTKFGHAGVLICNESIEEGLIKKLVKNNANFFFVTSNDGWFEDTYISKYHFYISRIMAVAYAKDFALSSNLGFSGFIRSNGDVVAIKKSSKPLVITNTISVNKTATFYSNYPNLFLILLFLPIILNVTLALKTRQD